AAPARVDVVVPAHDEAAGIAGTVRSLAAMEYPAGRFRVVVVADNCSDSTADVARAAGATVLERNDPTRRGKGHALALAFREALAGPADAVVVVDADTVASPQLLASFAERFAAGAHAVQARYGVRNAGDGWRTRLMSLAFTLFHDVRSLGRERLGLSCGLRGNGMGFSREALARVPYDAFSVVEDVEHGIQLALAGLRVEYVDEAAVQGEMPADAGASRSQRARWEGGRQALARQWRGRLLREGWRRRDPVLLDLAADLIVPPLSTLALAIVVGAAATAATAAAGWTSWAPAAIWLAALAALVIYVARGCALTGAGLRTALDLAWAPWYVLWKLALRASGAARAPRDWVRTRRASET
ncbi:MAG: glycosyltransferase, partial [Gemmatimonadaceae bacterium]